MRHAIPAIMALALVSCDSAAPHVPPSPDGSIALPPYPCEYSEIWTNGELGFPTVVEASHDIDPGVPGIQLDIWARFLKEEPPVVFQWRAKVYPTLRSGPWHHARIMADGSGEALFLARSPTGCPYVALVTVMAPWP